MRVVPFTFSSGNASCIDVSRKDAGTKLIDKAIVRLGPLTVLAVEGYNNGAQQFLLLFDAAAFPNANDEPIHTQVLAAGDNFYVDIPVAGLAMSKGLVLALSSTPAKYTAGATKDITFSGALNSNL